MEQLQQGLLLLGGQGGHPLPVPVKKYLVADGEGLLALFGQVQPVAAALLLFGEEAAFHQLCDAPLRVSPVQVQGPGQLCGSGARVLAYIEQKIQQAEMQPQFFQLPAGIGGEIPMQHGGAECKSLMHGKAPLLDLTRSSIHV